MINLENLTIYKENKKGNFYYNYSVVRESDNAFFFIKKISTYDFTTEGIKKCFENELKVGENYSHENIVKFIEKKRILNDFYLIYEYANGGTLDDFFYKYKEKNKHPFPEEIVQYILKNITNAYKYLYDNNILHRNLGLDHVFIFFNNEEDKNNMDLLKSKIKIGNFFFSKILENNPLTSSIKGKPMYMEPNMLICLNEKKEITYDIKIDIWPLGIITYELLIGQCPFEENDMNGLVNKIKDGIYKIPKNFNLSKEAVSFIKGILQKDPTKRFDINDVINHDFLNKDVKDFTHEGFEEFCDVNGNEIILKI
jgi:serine/threonine-protein kinase ULK/ATG1